MSDKYQFWLCDDAGNRLAILDDFSYFSYSRSNHGYGTIEIGMPYRVIVRPRLFFKPDWRIDVWRRPMPGMPLRRECSFLVRKFRVYRRAQDGMMMIIYYGRSPIDILRRFGGWRQIITNLAGENGDVEDYTYEWDSTGGSYPGNISEAMESIASGTFTQGGGSGAYIGFDVSVNPLGNLSPVLSNYYTFGRNALEMIQELSDSSIAQNILDPVNYKKVYFDVVETSEAVTGAEPRFNYKFKTYIGLRGIDRTDNIVFSTQNGNLLDPVMSEDWLDEYNTIIMFNKSAGISFAVQNPTAYAASLLNKNFRFISTSEQTMNGARTQARAELKKTQRQRTISATFLDSPGGSQQPRSLYGLDWDLGDLVKVNFAGFSFECEVMIVYVSMDEDGKESVTGRNEVGS